MLIYIITAAALWGAVVVFGTGYTRLFLKKHDEEPDKKKFRIFYLISGAFVLIVLANAAAAGIIKGASLINLPIIAFLCGITFYAAAVDIKLHLIPNVTTLVQLGGWAMVLIIEWLLYGENIITLLISSFIGGGTACLFFLLAKLISRGGVGMGDVKLITVMGLYLGINGLISMLTYSLLCAFFFGIFMLITKKGKLKTEIAMAPFFLIGVTIFTTLQIWS